MVMRTVMQRRRLDGFDPRGFTLLEVLIAMAILALAMPILLGLRNWDLNLHSRAADITAATMLAQEKLIEAELLPLYPVGETTGDFRDPPPGYQMPAEIAKIGGIGFSILGSLVAAVLLYQVTFVPARSRTNQPGAAPNSGSATQPGNSSVAEGPRSTSCLPRHSRCPAHRRRPESDRPRR